MTRTTRAEKTPLKRSNADLPPTVLGTARYEFLMQIRRPALWIVVAVFCLGFVTLISNPFGAFLGLSTSQTVARWALSVQFLHPVAAGVLLADRVPRDGRTKASELLETLPSSPAGRFVGKYVGATLATVVPLALVYAAGLGYVLFDGADPMAVPLGLAAFLTINLPGLLFVAAFSVSCPVVLWVPLYQFLFVGYWFWGNHLNPYLPIPTISDTILTPAGWYTAAGFFGLKDTNAGNATVWEGAASVVLLLALSGLALTCANRYLRWRQDQR